MSGLESQAWVPDDYRHLWSSRLAGEIDTENTGLAAVLGAVMAPGPRDLQSKGHTSGPRSPIQGCSKWGWLPGCVWFCWKGSPASHMVLLRVEKMQGRGISVSLHCSLFPPDFFFLSKIDVASHVCPLAVCVCVCEGGGQFESSYFPLQIYCLSVFEEGCVLTDRLQMSSSSSSSSPFTHLRFSSSTLLSTAHTSVQDVFYFKIFFNYYHCSFYINIYLKPRLKKVLRCMAEENNIL